MGSIQKKKCDCGIMVRDLINGMCRRCYNKTKTRITYKTGARVSLKKALEKIYEIKGYISKRGHLTALKSFPSILIGHKVRLVIVE